MNNKLKKLTLPLAVMTAMGTAPAFGAVLEEVIVTAQKRAESLQDVPISVAAVSGEAIEQAGIDDLQELSFAMPNVTITQEQISDRINIRGIASGGNQGFDQSVGLFSNGVYLAKGTQFRSAFLDVGSVEVLRGPQATLFGKNTIAGAVSITPRRPDYEFGGDIRVGYETEYDSWQASGAVSLPISETLAARVAFKTQDNNGYVENTLLNRDEPEAEMDNYRVSLLWEPTPELSINLSHEDFSQELDGKGFEVVAAEVIDEYPSEDAGSVLLSGDAACAAFGFPDCKLNHKTAATNTDLTGMDPVESDFFSTEEYSEVDTDLTALNISYQLGEYELVSVTGWSNSEIEELNPSAALPFPTSGTIQFEDFESFSQELRIVSPTGGAVEWIAGLYYEENEYELSETIHVNDYWLLGPFVTGDPGTVFGYNPTVQQDFEQESDTWAVFGQLTWNITDSFRSTLGLRYAEEEKQASQTYMHTVPSFGNFDLAFGAENHTIPTQTYEQEDWSPSLNFQWDVNAAIMLYASYAIGYKSGGFDARIANDGTLDRVEDTEAFIEAFEFEPEKATTWELGFKSTLADGAAEVNGAFFFTDYKNLQVSVYDGGLAFLVDNAGEVEVKGFEFEGRWQITDQLLLSGGGAWLDYEYIDYPAGPCDIYAAQALPPLSSCSVNLAGETGANTPEYSANATLDWSAPISEEIELQLGATVIYEDEFNVSPDLDPQLWQDSYTKLNLRAGLNSLNDTWGFAIIANNVTNEKTMHYGTDVPLIAGARFARPDAPRMITVEGVYRF